MPSPLCNQSPGYSLFSVYHSIFQCLWSVGSHLSLGEIFLFPFFFFFLLQGSTFGPAAQLFISTISVLIRAVWHMWCFSPRRNRSNCVLSVSEKNQMQSIWGLCVCESPVFYCKYFFILHRCPVKTNEREKSSEQKHTVCTFPPPS